MALLTLSMASKVFAQPSDGDGSRVGVPVVGNMGIQETVERIMAREAATPPSLTPRIHLRHVRNRQDLPQNPLSSYDTQWPPDSGGVSQLAFRPVPLAPQTVGTSFTGATLVDTFAFPPDTMGAVGPTQFIVAVNGRIRSFNKSTGVADSVLNANTDVFFSSVMTPPAANNFTSDPRIRYDRLSQRWVISIIDVPGTLGAVANRVLLAVSDVGSAGVISGGTAWTFFFFLGDATNFTDYDTLGIDNNALYIGANMFSTTNPFPFVGTNGYVVRKSSILGAGPIVVTPFANLTGTSVGPGPYTPQGVDNLYDPAATEGYFIGVDNATFGTLMLRRISTPGATPTISANISIAVSSTTFPIRVPHLGNTGGANGNLDALDDRLFAAHIRGGRLWTAHNIQVNASGVASNTGGRDGSRWYELQNVASPGTPTIFQSGTVFDSSATNPVSFWIPSIAVSGQGHAALGFSAAGAAARINAATVGRLSGDTLNTMQGPPVLYTASGTAYNPPSDPGGASGRRWGDYSYTSLDPNDDMTLWTIQEFCDTTNSYGVRIAKLVAPPPAAPDCTVPALVTTSPQNVTITGTSTAGSGFFDPGSGFPNRLQASVSGGVTVNSVTFNNPTSVTLNVNATTNGLRTVTLTNPDSQSVLGTNCISVTLAPVSDLSITKTDGQTTAVPGASITYTIVASNAGPSAVTGATVTDTVPATITGASWTCVGAGGGTCTASGSGNINDTAVNLPAGGTATYMLMGTINPAATGTLSNTATVAVPAGVTDPNPANNSATDTDTLTPQANLGITKTDGQTTAVPGQTVTYTIVASNAGPSPVTGATVTDTLPATITGASWTCVGAGGGTCTAIGSGNINDTAVNLPVGGTASYTLTGTINSAATGTLSNTAAVSVPSGVTDPTPANNSATDTDTLTPQANLGITKTDGQTTAIPGASLTYTIVASNAGPSAVTGATVTDTLPATISGASWTCVGAGGGTCTASGSGNINGTVNLPVGGSVTYTLTGTINPAATGTLSNTAAVAVPGGVTDPNPANNSATDTDTLTPQANLGITKTDGQTTAIPGASVTYTIVASNAGPSAVTGATVTDTLPATISGTSWTCVGAGGGTCTASGSGNINDTVNLPVGGSVTYTLTGTINPAAAGTLSNTAAVALPGGVTDPNPANNSATDTDTLTPQANLGITKTVAQTMAIPGQPVTYTIVASNAGPSAVTATLIPGNMATVTDTVPAAITAVSWTCVGAGGGTCSAGNSGNINDLVNLPVGGSVTYTLTGTVIASASGTISNTATVAVPPLVTDPNPANNSATASIRVGAGFYLLAAPCRILDTRGGGALAPNSVRNLVVVGPCGLPAGISAIATNVTVVSPAAEAYVTLYPGPIGSVRPFASTINYTPGRTLANNANVSVATDGSINIFNSGSAPLDFLMDVNGYFK